MSEEKRKRPKFKGSIKSRQHKRSKERRGNVDKSKMNDGAFYEGMPGCTVDENGNRKFLDIVMKPDGQATTMIYAHPQLTVAAVENAIDNNNMIRQVIYSAVVSHIFQKKTVWNWVLRTSYKKWYVTKQKKIAQVKEERMVAAMKNAPAPSDMKVVK